MSPAAPSSAIVDAGSGGSGNADDDSVEDAGTDAPQPTSPPPTTGDSGIDASSGSASASEDGGMSGGAIVGIVVGVLLALVLAIGVITWARGTPGPCIDKGNPYGTGKAAKSPMHMIPAYSNPAYVAGFNRAARGRTDSSA